MNRANGHSSPPDPESGLSLLEAVIGLLILAFAVIATLNVYDTGWKLFSRGENALNMQQRVRLGFERVGLDLQLAGYNYNPDGDDGRPDEPIEAAFDTAIVVRADFDGQDPTLSATPETTLDNGIFDIVSTGNDEIVAFVLAKPDGTSSDTLTFSADVEESPRDGDVETVSIANVELVHDDPPYSLYRISLNNDPTTWGTSDFVIRTLLAEDVYSLSFRYLDGSGTQLNSTFNLSSTADDIGGAETAVPLAQRSAIRRIQIDLVGMTHDPDLYWHDIDDTNVATNNHRKFQLFGDITPRNAGMVGLKDLTP